jgi:hypothetical protein
MSCASQNEQMRSNIPLDEVIARSDLPILCAPRSAYRELIGTASPEFAPAAGMIEQSERGPCNAFEQGPLWP